MNQQKMFFVGLILFVFILQILNFNSVFANSVEKVKKDTVTIGLSQEFDTLHPMIATMLASNYIFSLAGRSMLVIDANGKWVPQLAKKIPSLDNGLAKIINSPGEKSIQATWEIIEKAKWSDGTPVTCADFKFSLEVANSDSVAVSGREDYALVKSIDWDKKTPQKCLFTYKGMRWDFYQMPRFMPLPAHLEGPLFEKHGKETGVYDKNSNYSKNPTLMGLYNGPYRVTEVKPGSHISFEINPYFYGPTPQISKVIVKVLPDTTSLEAQFLTGAVDIVGPIGIGFDQALRLDKKFKQDNGSHYVQFQSSLAYEHIDVNLDNPILKDIRVRQALMFGINRKELVKAFFEDKQKVAHHFVCPVDPWYTDNPNKIRVYQFSKSKAEKLLTEAGWILKKEDGYRYKNGEKLTLSLMSTAGNKIREIVETYLQQHWKEIGIEITIKNEPPRVFFGDTVKKRKFPALAMYAWSIFPEKSPGQYHSKSIPSDANGWSGRNTMGWSNKKADQLIEKIESEMSAKKRLQYAQELQNIYSEDLPTLSLFYRADVALAPKNLKNYQLTGHQFSETNHIETWTFDGSM